MTRLTRDFFNRPTLEVAQDLLGKVVVRKIIKRDPSGKVGMTQEIKGRIIETEAYIGQGDQACHARHGKTKRNDVMWGEAGHSYIYLCMGLHNLLNIVTEAAGSPAAVLIRKIEPLSGLDTRLKSYGPGNLTKYLKIDRTLSNINLLESDTLYIEDDGHKVSDKMIERKPRVGIDYAGEDAALPWRFILKEAK